MSKPTFNAYVVTEPKEGSDRKPFWVKIGAVFPHKTGTGFDVVLDALPVNGRITCTEPKEKEPQQQ